MRGLLGAAAVAAGAGAAVAVARRRTTGRAERMDRWHSVTIACEPEELGPLPPPLDSLGFPVEVVIRPAPGGRGTELAARMTEPRGRDGVRALRKALREARQLVEVGEILQPDSPPTTERTLTGAPLAYATRHGKEEGRL
ncbi:hypothetical protein Val02_23500 [Virgisporangium aliadipatigenens]|uniref:Uncharacterized protein n=1 Tax=Virgisporangium aliadipatigenens TaxID=741659 RepID=A0A8J3YHN6_9ACTN|nr:hypothetical protein [Virgisporangium aliadipatigenens]GIJ45464.1 hypothetical protein Val02_23500 [Virgisporangium aliadipatigenens]